MDFGCNMSVDMARRVAGCGQYLRSSRAVAAVAQWRIYLVLVGLFAVAASDGVIRMANAFTVEVDATSARVLIEARNVQVDDILSELAAAKGFSIERPDNDVRNRAWSGRFEGPLDIAIERLLSGENYIIEHSKVARGGIERLRLFESDRSALPEDGTVPHDPNSQQPRHAPQAAPVAAAPPAAPAIRTRSSRSTPSSASLQQAPAVRQPTLADSAPINQAATGMRRRGGVIQ